MDRPITFEFALDKNLPIHPIQLATLEIESRNWPHGRQFGYRILRKVRNPAHNSRIETYLPATPVNRETYGTEGCVCTIKSANTRP
jgi:hypothetical protein